MKKQDIKASFIIPFKNADGSREKIFLFMLSYLKHYFPNSEVVIVENDLEQNIPDITQYREGYDVRYFFIRNQSVANLFNKSVCMNKGYKMAKYPDKLVFMDFDMFLKPSDITESLNELENSNIVSPYTMQLIDLNEDDTDYIMENFKDITSEKFMKIDNQVIRDAHILCGGIFMTTRENMDIVGGYPEQLFAWGSEDEIVSINFNKVLGNIKLLNKKVYHLHHKPAKKTTSLVNMKWEIMKFFHYIPAEDFVKHKCDFLKLLDKNRLLKNNYKSYIEDLGYSLQK